MPRGDIPRNNAPGTRAKVGQALTWVAGDTVNGHRILATGRELLLACNSGATPRTVAVDSTPDAMGREGDIPAQSLAAGATWAFGPWQPEGWVDAAGYINVDVNHAEVLLAVILLPY